VTEAEWLASDDPFSMLDFLHRAGHGSKRQHRLYAAACCRQVWHLLEDERSRRAVEVAEQFADGVVTDEDRAAAHTAAMAAWSGRKGESTERMFASLAAALAAGGATRAAVRGAGLAVKWSADDSHRAAEAAKRKEQAAILRDVVGNPFRPTPVDTSWLASRVVAFAQATYDQRELPAGTLDATRLAVLADALEDAGCTDSDLLAHLRGPGPHVRGCWAVDLLLGKA
jgi:hypothetical protein